MSKVISLAQIKGGCGKTTVSCHVAGILSKLGKSVAIIDADSPQFSLSNWYNIGPDKKGIELAQVETAEQLLQAVEYYDNKVDFIVIDLAPRLQGLTRAGVAVSDITIVPVNTDMVEIWALELTISLMREAQEKISNFKYYVLNNKFRPDNPNHQIMRTAIKEQYACKLLDNTLGGRTPITNAVGQGHIIHDLKPRNAKAIEEMEAVVSEIINKLEHAHE